ncbi:MAG: hypothetical protein Q8S33_35425 [Myxococcales bacterium]|nr:hypothetical protein [Myxococcales bacterium]MDP3505688.1 hypothetical protein [Myxococcales bacterium]
MTPTTYTAEQLKKNRASMLMVGGAEADRRAFALAAAQALPGEPFVEVKEAAQVLRALKSHRGTVYVPDASALPAATQREVVRVLREQEERPRFVFGLATSVETANEKGGLTDDLRYWLRSATIDVRKKGR